MLQSVSRYKGYPTSILPIIGTYTLEGWTDALAPSRIPIHMIHSHLALSR